jgi:D-alanyl-D-alanine carboxypeptidase
MRLKRRVMAYPATNWNRVLPDSRLAEGDVTFPKGTFREAMLYRRILAIVCLLWLGLAVAMFAKGETSAPPALAEAARDAEELLRHNYRGSGPGAAVLVARGDTVLFRAARGEADVGRHLPLQPDSVFRIGSIGKQFTAAALLTLVEAGKVRLDDPLSRYLPDYPGGDRITILQLLNHTSGVKNYSALPGYVEKTIRQDMTTAQIIDLFKNERPDFAPGSQWAYSNSGYTLIGAVIEAVTRKPWHVYFDEVLFKPLGLRHTGYAHDSAVAKQLVQGYTREADKVVPMRPMSMTQPHAAGSLVSNVDDLLRWNRALHQGRILKNDTYIKMVVPVGKAADPGIGYGFGLYNEKVRKNAMLRHGGRIFGYNASLNYLPGPGITVVVLQNSDVPIGDDTPETLAKKLAAIALGDPYPEMRAIDVNASALAEAEGVYRFDSGTTRALRVVDGKLTAQRNGGPRIGLTPIAADDFLYADGFNRLTIARDAGGNIRGIWFFANGDGEGEFGERTNEPLPVLSASLRLSPREMERLVGTYANGGLMLKVFIDGEALNAQLAGQAPVGLRASSPTNFEVEESGATLVFSDGDAPAAEVTIRQNGQTVVLKRLAD